MIRALIALLVLGAAGAAAAQTPARCFANPERWAYDRTRETLAAPGERFLEDMRTCDASFAASVIEAVRYQIHKEEAEKFTRASSFVMAAYGVAWALLAASAIAVWLRQRKLTAEIAALEARVREAGVP
jgi:hypothetical protein